MIHIGKAMTRVAAYLNAEGFKEMAVEVCDDCAMEEDFSSPLEFERATAHNWCAEVIPYPTLGVYYEFDEQRFRQDVQDALKSLLGDNLQFEWMPTNELELTRPDAEYPDPYTILTEEEFEAWTQTLK